MACLALISVVYPLRFLKIKTRGRALQLFAGSIIVMVFAAVNVTDKAPTDTAEIKLPDVAPVAASVTAELPTPIKTATLTPSLPTEQKRFIEIIEHARNQFDEAKNDLAKGATRPARAKAICSAFRSKQVRDWIGRVYRLSSNSDGKGVLTIEVGEQIRLGTTNNALSDVAYPSLI